MRYLTRRLTARKIAFYAALIGVWQVAADLGPWPEEIFPSPYEIAEDLAYGVADGTILLGMGTSIWRLVTGLAIAYGGGVALGILMARVEAVNQTAGSLVLGLQSIPSIAWVPLALIWFGISDAGIIFVTAVGAVFAVTIGTYTGVKNIDPHYIEAARNMGARGGQLITSVLIPAAFPFMISGLKQGWAFAWRGVIGAEILFSYLGLGYLLNVGRQTIDVSQVMAVMLLIMALGMVMDGLVFKRLEQKVMSRWGLG